MVSGTDLTVSITSLDDDIEELGQLGRRLRAELLELDIADAEPVSEPEPEHAKGVSAIAGALAVRLGSSALIAVVQKVRDWVGRTGRTVEITIDGDTLKVGGISAARQEQLVDAWLARHAPSGGS
jgi:hypothetical protein